MATEYYAFVDLRPTNASTDKEVKRMFFSKLDEEIAAYMRRNSINQEEMASRLRMSSNTFSWKRRGVREFSLSEAIELCDLLGITLDEATGRSRKEQDESKYSKGR